MTASSADASAAPLAALDATTRGNGITALRLGLALWVLLMHVWPAGGFGPDPVATITGGRLDGGGGIAVWGFFGLSGFLLAGSRAHLPVYAFAWRRMLRILPGYWVCILLTSVVVGSWYVNATFNPLGWVGAPTWDGFASNPSDLVNASLWTLPVELACYIVLALIPGRALRVVVPVLAVVFAGWVLTGGLAFAGWQPPIFAFAMGLLVSIWRVPLRAPIAVAGMLVACATVSSPLGTLVAVVGLVYGLLWVGMVLPLRWTTDLSYGTYIYAFPVTQMLVLAGVGQLGPLALALTAGLATLLMAAASWFLIERPALSLKSVASYRTRRAVIVPA